MSDVTTPPAAGTVAGDSDAPAIRDVFDKIADDKDLKRAQVAIAAGYYPFFLPMAETEGTEVVYKGRRLIMAGSNNYLGLTTHPKVREAAIEAIRHYGTSCTGSRYLNGNLEIHEQLERELAEYVGKDATLVFSTGFQVNLGTIDALISREDVIVIDRDDHASIVVGSRLSRADIKRFKHNDMADLERVLAGIPPTVGRMVVVDGVYSMGGDIAPLPEIVALCKRYGARLFVDDAHSIGVLGGGRGTAAHFGVTADVNLIMGTFSKSFASLGGFVAGDATVIQFVKHHAPSLIFSASIPPSNLAAALAALHIMRDEPEHVEQVNRNAQKMRDGLRSLGFNIGNSQTPVVPVFIGDEMKTIVTWRALFDDGIYVNPVFPPGVPPNQCILRTSYMATHTDAQLDKVLEVFAVVGKKMGLIS